MRKNTTPKGKQPGFGEHRHPERDEQGSGDDRLRVFERAVPACLRNRAGHLAPTISP
jgi:hypothetical protein